MQILEKLEKPQSAELNLLTSISSLCHKVKKKKKKNQHVRDRGKEGGVLCDVSRRIFHLTECTWLPGLLEKHTSKWGQSSARACFFKHDT